jgi:hypothetical protein
MIRILGLNRIIWIVACILLMAGVGAGVYYYLTPELERYQGEVKKVNGQITMKRGQIQQLKLEYAQLKDQIVKFNKIKASGFFNAQDRVTARETIKELTSQARLLKSELNLQPGSVQNNPKAAETSYVLISGPMSIKINSLDDISAYKFVVALQKIFPGYLEFKSLTMKRAKELDRTVLKGILEGKPDTMIEGTAEFVWWSMASQKQMAANPYFNPAAMPATTPEPLRPPVDAPMPNGGPR